MIEGLVAADLRSQSIAVEWQCDPNEEVLVALTRQDHRLVTPAIKHTAVPGSTRQLERWDELEPATTYEIILVGRDNVRQMQVRTRPSS
jgi:hypothetical protein